MNKNFNLIFFLLGICLLQTACVVNSQSYEMNSKGQLSIYNHEVPSQLPVKRPPLLYLVRVQNQSAFEQKSKQNISFGFSSLSMAQLSYRISFLIADYNALKLLEEEIKELNLQKYADNLDIGSARAIKNQIHKIGIIDCKQIDIYRNSVLKMDKVATSENFHEYICLEEIY